MDFNKERFVNFARYDLAINKKFYRNLALFTVVGAMGIALYGFMIRWNIWRSIADNYSAEGCMPGSEVWYAWNSVGTSGFLFAFCAIMLTIFSGCWAHNLRTRQGRIIELTLPASNAEKFLWHTGLMVGGGFLLVVLSMLLADGLNAILCLCTVPEGIEIQSLSTQIWSLITIQITESFKAVKWICMAITLSSLLLQIGFYMYGNALKYKYNIILTYIAEQIISAVIFIAILICGATIVQSFSAVIFSTNTIENEEDIERIIGYGLYAFAACEVIVAAVLVWLSYRQYVKAQLITPLNK